MIGYGRLLREARRWLGVGWQFQHEEEAHEQRREFSQFALLSEDMERQLEK